MLQPSPTTFSEVFQCMFDYIDRLFVMVRPRKLMYMAIGTFFMNLYADYSAPTIFLPISIIMQLGICRVVSYSFKCC